MGIDISQYRSSIGSFLGTASNSTPKTKAKIQKQEEEEINKIIHNEALNFWKNMLTLLVLATSAWYLIQSTATLFEDYPVSVNLKKTTGITNPFTVENSNLMMSSLAIATYKKTLLIISGNVEENPGPVNRMEATKQELEPGKCKICAKTFRGAIGLSV